MLREDHQAVRIAHLAGLDVHTIRASDDGGSHAGPLPHVLPCGGGGLLRPSQGRQVGDGLQMYPLAMSDTNPAEDHRERKSENNQTHRVDGPGSFLAGTVAGAPIHDRPTSGHSRAPGYPFMRHGRFPSSMVVTVQRAMPPIQPAAPR